MRFLQCLLLSLRLDAGKNLIPDGEYGLMTIAAVKELQDEVLGMTKAEIDGNFGPHTRKMLFDAFGTDSFGITIDDIPASAFPGTTTWFGPKTTGPQIWPQPPAEETQSSGEGIPLEHRADGSIPVPCA